MKTNRLGWFLLPSALLVNCGSASKGGTPTDVEATGSGGQGSSGGHGGDRGGGGATAGFLDSGAPALDPNRTYAPTFEAVWNEVLHPSCAWEFCHGGDPEFLDFSSKEKAYATLVNVPAVGPDCKPTGLMHVAPGKPDESLVYLKVTNPPCGTRMPPPFGTVPLDARSIAQLRRWIERGAPNDSRWDGGLGAPPADAAADASPALVDSGIIADAR